MAKDIIKTMRENSKKGSIGYASNVTKSIGYTSSQKLKNTNKKSHIPIGIWDIHIIIFSLTILDKELIL